ncbi:MAG: hypothetical protein JW820_08075 [Spirochaetales bacterium]|nr:hypothetical protein [Spirochaetales bacterium]
MKQTVQMDRIQEKMAPGVITLDGFLGTDPRKLIDILVEDDEEVKRLNLTHQGIAQRMIELREAGMQGLGEFIEVAAHFEVRVDSVRGKLPCPFGDPGVFPKTNITVRNLELEREVVFTDLHIHMIYSHGFYEGKGSKFRLEPAVLAAVLEVEPAE